MAEDLLDLLASFQRDLRAEGKAARTLVIYGQSVRFYRDWLLAHDHGTTRDDLSRPLIREWLANLADTKAPGTVLTRFRGLRRFCKWLLIEEELTVDPMSGMEQPKAPDKPVPVLTDNELTLLIKACAGKAFIDRRDEAMVRFLLDTGVRVSEMVGLEIPNLEIDGGSAVVTGKGNKIRAVYFGARTTRALDRYLRMRAKHRWAHLSAVFLGERGATTADGVRDRLEVRAEQAGIVDPANPHRFRHTFAHDFLLAGGQERDLKRLAGWSSDAMLERYGASAADLRAREATKRLRRGDRV